MAGSLRMNPFTGKPEFINETPVINNQTGQTANTAGQTATASVAPVVPTPVDVVPQQPPFEVEKGREQDVTIMDEGRTTNDVADFRDQAETAFQTQVSGFLQGQQSFQEKLLASLEPTAEEQAALQRVQDVRAKQEQLASELNQTQGVSEGRLVDIGTIRGEQEQAARVASDLGLEFGLEERRALDDLTRLTGDRQAHQEVLKTAAAFNAQNLDSAIELHKLFETERPDAEIRTIGNKVISIQDGVADVIYEGDASDDPDKFDNTVKLRKDFVAQSKDFVSVRDAYAKVLAAPKSAAGDLAMIFNYMKMLDPGSVVREGEFATAQNAAGVPEQVRNFYNRAKTGERLSGTQVADFRNTASHIYKSQLDLQNQNRAQTQKLASDFGLDGEQVAPDLGLATPTGQTAGGSQPVVDELPELAPISDEVLAELGLSDDLFVFE